MLLIKYITNFYSCEIKVKLQSIGIDGFWIHYNPSAGRRLFEKGGWVLLFGNKLSKDSYGLTYGPTAFQQQIQGLYLESLSRAEVFLDPEPTNSLIDLYSGTGIALKRWRDRGIAAIGVETSGEALECAKDNAPRSTLLRGSCRLRIPQLTQWMLQQVFLSKRILLYANPPRTGIEPETLEWIVRVAKPDRIAYLSCSPGTLGKNLHFLTQKGYRVVEIQPYDFFPNTHHVECLALLSLKK